MLLITSHLNNGFKELNLKEI